MESKNIVLREAVLNAVVHKDYNTGNLIHIKIYNNKVIIYNDCRIPSNLKPESLLIIFFLYYNWKKMLEIILGLLGIFSFRRLIEKITINGDLNKVTSFINNIAII